jgi:hypothetical protein
MNSRRVWLGLEVFAILLLALAWLDGGREPVHEIAAPVAVPGGAG